MERRQFVKVLGMSAFAVSTTGFRLMDLDGKITTDCATSTDILGPFYRKKAPLRQDLTYEGNDIEIPLKVIGQVFGADCQTPLDNIDIDVWHCDHEKNYDMDTQEYRCRGKVRTNSNGEYWYKTFVPPPYGLRPKHIHYLVHGGEKYENLVTQLYFKGDDRIQEENWIKYRWDERRILEIYKNAEGLEEVRLDLFLTRS